MATAQIHISPTDLGLIRVPENPVGAFEAASRLLQKNHDEHHIFWRSVAGHNHISHSVLSIFALGGDVADLQRAFDDGKEIQKPMPAVDAHLVKALSNPDTFAATMGTLDQYTNFLAFFTKEIDAKGWIVVLQEQLFSRTKNAERMFHQLFEGLYHPLIHIGLGVEFAVPAIIAEGLALAASHDSMGTEKYLVLSESAASQSTKPTKSLVQLLRTVRANDSLRTVAHGFTDGVARVRDGVLGPQNIHQLADLASQFRIQPEHLQRGLADSVNGSAFETGAAARPGKERKIDFFAMHGTTSNIPLTVLVRQPWISVADKIRLVEFKTRLDLVWYAASAAVELRLEDIVEYKPSSSAGWDWSALFRATLAVHDDGHLAKLIRALKNGEEVSKPFEEEGDNDTFPVKGASWLKIAQMAYDSTVDREILQKWIWGIGFDENWAKVPSL